LSCHDICAVKLAQDKIARPQLARPQNRPVKISPSKQPADERTSSNLPYEIDITTTGLQTLSGENPAFVIGKEAG